MSFDSAPFSPTISILRATALVPLPSTALTFSNPTPSPSALPNPVYPRGPPHHVVIILISTIPTVFALALIMGTIHCVRKRNKHKIQTLHQADIEKSLRLAQRPVLAIDTDVPRAIGGHRLASGGRLTGPFVPEYRDHGLPRIPAVAHVRGEEGRKDVFTRNSMLEPGVGGR